MLDWVDKNRRLLSKGFVRQYEEYVPIFNEDEEVVKFHNVHIEWTVFDKYNNVGFKPIRKQLMEPIWNKTSGLYELLPVSCFAYNINDYEFSVEWNGRLYQ
ncbi:hypothetical protein C4577_01995 [Candidatus Parcubacteria bacterium]|nr:MAG: hypothetical protein C4577_01995 [Candidatus Parcubacteria bacterium]